MILMVIGGLKPERQKLASLLGSNIPNFVVRRSIYQPIKIVVSDNDPVNKLTLIDKNLPYIGDTTDFFNHTNKELLAKIETVKDTFEACFEKTYMLNHFNNGLAPSQYFKYTASSGKSKPIFIIDDIEKKDDLSFMYENLKKLCIDSKHLIGKSLFSSINDLMKKGGIDQSEMEKVRAQEREVDYMSERGQSRKKEEPEILTIVIKNEDNSISQVYPGATIKNMSDLSSYENIIEISTTDLNKNLNSLSLLIYNIFYKEDVKKEFK